MSFLETLLSSFQEALLRLLPSFVPAVLVWLSVGPGMPAVFAAWGYLAVSFVVLLALDRRAGR